MSGAFTISCHPSQPWHVCALQTQLKLVAMVLRFLTCASQIPQRGLKVRVTQQVRDRPRAHAGTRAAESPTSIRPRPVNPPATSCHGNPEEFFRLCSSRIVVKQSGSLVEPASVPRVRKSEPLEIEMMTELVAQRTQERSEGRDFFPHRRPHPHPDHHGFRTVIPEEFARPLFADSQRSGCKNAEAAVRDFVKARGRCQKFCACTADINRSCALHRRLYGFCNRQQAPVLRQVERLDAVAFEKTSPTCLSRCSVSQHCIPIQSRKTRRPRNNSRAVPLRTLLTACNVPHRASSCSVWADRPSSVGLNNCLLVGRITSSVKGMTEPSRISAMSHQNVAPKSQAAMDDSRPKAANVTCMMVPR